MLIYNLKLNKKALSISFIIISVLIVLFIIGFSIYIIFFKNSENAMVSKVSDDGIIQLNEKNYTDILKASNENIDSFVGKKVKITGYVYRLLDFMENEFVIARDMKLEESSQAIIVGFLCNYNKASDYPDGVWIEVVGEIVKGHFNGDIAMLQIISIKETNRPDILLVEPPHKNYIPTSYFF